MCKQLALTENGAVCKLSVNGNIQILGMTQNTKVAFNDLKSFTFACWYFVHQTTLNDGKSKMCFRNWNLLFTKAFKPFAYAQ